MTTTPPPTALRGAVGVWLALGVFGLVNVLYLWVRRDALRESALRDGIAPADQIDSTVTTLIVQLTVAALLFAGAYALFALMLRRGRRSARVALTVIAGLHLLWVVLPGVSAANLVTVLLIAIGLALTWRPVTAHWLKEQ
jgi:hypothetical protein